MEKMEEVQVTGRGVGIVTGKKANSKKEKHWNWGKRNSQAAIARSFTLTNCSLISCITLSVVVNYRGHETGNKFWKHSSYVHPRGERTKGWGYYRPEQPVRACQSFTTRNRYQTQIVLQLYFWSVRGFHTVINHCHRRVESIYYFFLTARHLSFEPRMGLRTFRKRSSQKVLYVRHSFFRHPILLISSTIGRL